MCFAENNEINIYTVPFIFISISILRITVDPFDRQDYDGLLYHDIGLLYHDTEGSAKDTVDNLFYPSMSGE